MARLMQTVVGNLSNQATGCSAFVSGGTDDFYGIYCSCPNYATGTSSVVVGGYGNCAGVLASAIVGGRSNSITSFYWGAIVGGSSNSISANDAVVVGGSNNTVTGTDSAVVGGFGHTVSGHCSAAIGGNCNAVSVGGSAILGGSNNGISCYAGGSVIAGGFNNCITCFGSSSAISGGTNNCIVGYYSAIVGGMVNSISGWYSAIAGGYCNSATSSCKFIGGGSYNSGSRTIIGGINVQLGSSTPTNIATGYGIIPQVNPKKDYNVVWGLRDDGVVSYNAQLQANGGDYAEYFESHDGSCIYPGFFVTFYPGTCYICIAKSTDTYILGVTLANPAVVGDVQPFHWKKAYKTDEFGRVIFNPRSVQKSTRVYTFTEEGLQNLAAVKLPWYIKVKVDYMLKNSQFSILELEYWRFFNYYKHILEVYNLLKYVASSSDTIEPAILPDNLVSTLITSINRKSPFVEGFELIIQNYISLEVYSTFVNSYRSGNPVEITSDGIEAGIAKAKALVDLLEQNFDFVPEELWQPDVSEGYEEYYVYEPELSEEFDPTLDYEPRETRPEWTAVGLLGKLWVYLDPDSEIPSVGDFVKPSDRGMAMLSTDPTDPFRYYVLEVKSFTNGVVNPEITEGVLVRILFK